MVYLHANTHVLVFLCDTGTATRSGRSEIDLRNREFVVNYINIYRTNSFFEQCHCVVYFIVANNMSDYLGGIWGNMTPICYYRATMGALYTLTDIRLSSLLIRLK